MKVIIAAAGTGGHINPGIAIANKIMEKEPDSKIIFIGTDRGLETDLVPRAGYELKKIDAYGINRKINLDNIKRLYKTIKSVGQAKKILQEFNPDIVVGTGGYICVAVGRAAQKLNIPIVLHESNAFPGIAVKLFSKRAKILLGFEDARTRLPKARELVVTGTPSKISKTRLSESQKKDKIKELGLKENMPIVLVFGGSQGAKSINEAMLGIIKNRLNAKYQIIWAAGQKNYNELKTNFEKQNSNIDNIENVKILPYIYNMQEIMELSNLMVCRSGAMTITEISTLGKPAIFIPFPFATENHQEYNARVLEKVNAAKIILDKDLTSSKLNITINEMVSDTSKLAQMGENAKKVAIQNVEDRIYAEIVKYCNIKNKI